MGVTEELMGDSKITVPIRPDASRALLRDIALDQNLWATILVTGEHHDFADVGVGLFSHVRFAGVYLEQEADGSLLGNGREWWLGNSGDGGSLSVGVDATHTGRDFEDHLDNDVFGASNAIANGLSKGQVDTTGTTFSFKEEGGDTPREILDTLCRIAPGGLNFWRINPNGTIDADHPADLWPTVTTPTVLLTGEGGREANIIGLPADLKVNALNGREVRTGAYVDWQDGVDNGVASLTIPARWTRFDGGTPRVRHYMDWRPNRPKPPTERWRKVAPWRINSLARANDMAANELTERTSVRREISAEVEVYDPHRYDITPGNHVYLYDLDQGLKDTANQETFRGDTTFPLTARVDSMDWPILDGYGVYLLRWRASSIDLVDLTPAVDFEEGPTVLQMGSRDRFPVRRVRTTAVTGRDKRRIRRQSHRDAQLYRFSQSGYFR